MTSERRDQIRECLMHATLNTSLSPSELKVIWGVRAIREAGAEVDLTMDDAVVERGIVMVASQISVNAGAVFDEKCAYLSMVEDICANVGVSGVVVSDVTSWASDPDGNGPWGGTSLDDIIDAITELSAALGKAVADDISSEEEDEASELIAALDHAKATIEHEVETIARE